MFKRFIAFLAAIAFVVGLAFFLFVYMPHWFSSENYSKSYVQEVERYSKEFGIEESFVYAVIKTESNFNPDAVSEAGAIGLMQIISDSFEWVSYRLDDTELCFDDMFIPENSIRYGCYMLSYLYNKYGSYELTAAAYHSGMGEVDSWIANGIVNVASPNVSDFVGSNTRHYVNKIMKAYNKYKENEEKEQIICQN